MDISLDAANALESAIDRKIEQAAANRTRAYGEVSRIEADGTVYVMLDGAETDTPASANAAAVKEGERVGVTVEGGEMVIDGNFSAPATDDTAAKRAQSTADAAIRSADTAATAAAEAQASAEVAAGAAEDAVEAAEAAQDSLMSVVQGATTVEKAVSVMQTAMESIIDYDPNTTQETFTGDGSTTAYALQTEATDVLAVEVDGEAAEYTSATVGGVTVITFAEAPASSAAISITYEHATVQEWFWHDANGAHVLGDTSGYRNDITSSGMDIKQVSTEDSVAQFGASGARVGKSNGGRVEVKNYGIDIYGKGPTSVVMAARIGVTNDAETGLATVTNYGYVEAVSSSGTTYRGLSLSSVASSLVSVKIDNVDKTQSSTLVASGTIVSCPTADLGAEIEVEYKTRANVMMAAFGSSASASGSNSMACGTNTSASGPSSVALGQQTISYGTASVAEGVLSKTYGRASHAEGQGSKAKNLASHAEGRYTVAQGLYSHAQNEYTIAAKNAQTALGTYNVEDTASTTTHPNGFNTYGQYAVILGNGTADNARSNALAVDWSGNVLIDGDVQDMSGNAKYLPLSGGTLSGDLAVASTNPHITIKDTDAESNVTTSGEFAWLLFQDKNGTTLGRINKWIDGGVQYMRYVTNRLISGTTKANNLSLGIDASGNAVVHIEGTGAAAAWRSAIGALSTGGGTVAGTINRNITASTGYINSWDDNVPLIRLTKSENSDIWWPILALRTKGGGGWAIGNYNDETLEFIYGTKANITSHTNTTTQISFTESGGANFTGTIKQNGTAVSLSGHTHAAGDITSGTLDAARIPSLATSKITNLGEVPTDATAIGVSLATSTVTNVCSKSLTAGTWVVTASCTISSNATGRRIAKLTTTSNDADDGYGAVKTMAVSGATTVFNLCIVRSLSATTTVYLTAWQNSGSALTVAGRIRAVRIK